MLNLGSQMQRSAEKDALKKLGYNLYVPQDNEEINDKAALVNTEDLAERIVRHDTDGIITSDIVVMEAREAALGTCIELGQIKGMRDLARDFIALIEASGMQPNTLQNLYDACHNVMAKDIYVHNSDIRRGGNPTETGDRRSYGPHQYMYGVVLDVTDGHGYREFDEILEELKTDDA